MNLRSGGIVCLHSEFNLPVLATKDFRSELWLRVHDLVKFAPAAEVRIGDRQAFVSCTRTPHILALIRTVIHSIGLGLGFLAWA